MQPLVFTSAGAAHFSTTAGAVLGLPSAGTIARPCHVAYIITRFFLRARWLIFLPWFALIFIKSLNT